MKLKMLGWSLCLLILLGGCGSTKHARHYISAEELNIARAKQTIALGVIRCIREEQRNKEESAIGKLSERESLEVGKAVRELITIYRKNPNTLHIYLAEEAENLQGCWPSLTRKIRTVLTYG